MAITTRDLQHLLALIAEEMEKNRDRLCELDGVIGDGDHGLAMDAGCQAITKAVGELDAAQTAPTLLFNIAAKAFLNAVGASSGPLYATAFMRAGAAAKDKQALSDDDLLSVVAAMAQGIHERGKAEIGEKTMMDAWGPAANAALEARRQGASLSQCLAAAVQAARKGCEATSGMVATKGRAARLGDRAVGHVDPGAASAVIMIESMARFASAREG
ncbi:dihydroxyacetone kinase ADP-binding subunit L 1 (plasmid) [Rhizobium etli 8C-3]|uniref:Dihydroxyacetone kinase DhaL subunit n=2 Tax=Rhizobium TaxID=379 RepID=A0A4R3S169_9HYPH|nr:MULTISPECIES: dihydroxyacetone kinase subunit DhaL [Rhizobium]APO78085.1 dihydroxyacetone kinase ADP-binding subunit L 1 [Rhizobium etli 8C-3]TCU31041.1 dihydroxyacetone kinase DhaL subunit [Rhizobium azibense]TCU40937.1 dihydroxyacetone kinase DhaL subunit [Rhizobium azibense]